MIASRVGLAVLAALAVALALLVALDHAPPAIDHALVAGFDPDRVIELAWRRAGQPDVVLTHEPGGWSWREPAGLADQRRVGEVLAALRGARWHRRGARDRAGAVGTTLQVTSRDQTITFTIASPVAGTEQVWLLVGDQALLVDAWVTRALDPAPLELRDTAPLAGAASAALIWLDPRRLDGVQRHLEGTPRRLVVTEMPISKTTPPEHTMWPRPELVAALERALAALVVVDLPPGPDGHGDRGVALVAHDHTVTSIEVDGACAGHPTEVRIDGPGGRGCVTAAAWQAARAAMAAFDDPETFLDRRPLPVSPSRLVLPDGSVLELAGVPQLVIGPSRGDIDPTALTELLAALTAPAELVALPGGHAGGTQARSIIVTSSGVELSLDLFAPDTIVRRGEPRGLRVGAGVWQLLLRPGTAYRTRVLWREEPTTITTITIDGIAWQRGAVIGEWQRAHEVAPAQVAAKLEALVGQLAAPEAIADGAHFAAVHRVTLTVTAPGTPATHALDLGAPTAAGCPVHTDRDLILPAAACAVP